MRWLFRLAIANTALAVASISRPNIILIMTDDQDLHLNSTAYQPILQEMMVAQGTSFTNHYATVAQCCPSRASLLRGQAAHNTNITYVEEPGGNFDKWLISKQNEDYLPHWLVQAGYNAEYIGKFMNGYNVVNYATAPGGWTHVDALVDPYTYAYNNVVMSADGETPISYHNYHQTDVIRAKALDRLDYLSSQDNPFYLTIAPTSPHFSKDVQLPIPLSRHDNDYPLAFAPRNPNWNPADEYTAQKVSYLKTLGKLNATAITGIDIFYRARIRCLQGIDEIIHDVINKVEEKGLLDNTYIIYTSDHGYHMGTHRMAPSKALPYREDTNVPFIVRGPNVAANAVSRTPSVHLDLGPTFLELTGLPTQDWPTFLDGRSLVSAWIESPSGSSGNGSNSSSTTTDDYPEIMNIEFWGKQAAEFIPFGNYSDNSYKTLRIVGDKTSYLYSRWCTNETELYDTAADPWELTNLAIDPDAETARLMTRLNAILMATKSCAEVTCRNPWRLLQPDLPPQTVAEPGPDHPLTVTSLAQAMDPRYDAFFASVPQVAFRECLEYQYRPNEMPYWPADSASLGQEYRAPTDNFISTDAGAELVQGNGIPAGSWAQRNATIAEIMKDAHVLNCTELGRC